MSESQQDAPAHDRPARVRILVVDDHRMLRDSLVLLLEHERDFEVVGAVGSAAAARRATADLAPDVVLMDVSLPDANGVEATRAIRTDHQDVRVIGLSMHDDEEVGEAMRQAGATAYLSKAGSPRVLVEAIRRQARLDPDA